MDSLTGTTDHAGYDPHLDCSEMFIDWDGDELVELSFRDKKPLTEFRADVLQAVTDVQVCLGNEGYKAYSSEDQIIYDLHLPAVRVLHIALIEALTNYIEKNKEPLSKELPPIKRLLMSCVFPKTSSVPDLSVEDLEAIKCLIVTACEGLSTHINFQFEIARSIYYLYTNLIDTQLFHPKPVVSMEG